jgi:hypothetical protein
MRRANVAGSFSSTLQACSENTAEMKRRSHGNFSAMDWSIWSHQMATARLGHHFSMPCPAF